MVVPSFCLNPQHLRSFYYAAVYRNFTVAADKVYYAGQPTVSNHIKELERQLGTLFKRQARGVELTPRGRVLFDLVAPLLEGLEKLQEDFDEQSGGLPVARVTVSVSESLGYEFLSGVLKQFKEKRPQVTLTVPVAPFSSRDGVQRPGGFWCRLHGQPLARPQLQGVSLGSHCSNHSIRPRVSGGIRGESPGGDSALSIRATGEAVGYAEDDRR